MGRQYTVDRQKLTEPIVIPRFAVSWYRGIQPGRLAELMHGPDDGLLARFIWFWPDSLRFDKPGWPPATEWAIAAFDRLRMLELANGDDGPVPLAVPLDDAAADHMVGIRTLPPQPDPVPREPPTQKAVPNAPIEFPQRYTPTVRQFENSPKYAACRQAESRSIFSQLARSR